MVPKKTIVKMVIKSQLFTCMPVPLLIKPILLVLLIFSELYANKLKEKTSIRKINNKINRPLPGSLAKV